MKIKLGFDVHGVLDTHFDRYHKLISSFDRNKVEIHIISGMKEHLALIETPNLQVLNYDKWFSIHQRCEELGVDIKFDHKNRPLVDPKIWDIQKADYCHREEILFLFDDSPHYGQHMDPNIVVYLQQHNPSWKDWRHET